MPTCPNPYEDESALTHRGARMDKLERNPTRLGLDSIIYHEMHYDRGFRVRDVPTRYLVVSVL
jgi:hypothetical protein